MLIEKKYNGTGSETLLQPDVGAIVWDGYIDAEKGRCVLSVGENVREFNGVKTTTGIILCANKRPLTIEYSGAVRVLMDYAELSE